MRLRNCCLSGLSCIGLLVGSAWAETGPAAKSLVIASGLPATQPAQMAVAGRVARLRAAYLASHTADTRPSGAALALTSGAVLSRSVTVGEVKSYLALQFGFTADSTGLNGASFTFTAPEGGRTTTITFSQGVYSVGGTTKFVYPAPFPFFTMPGTWTLTGATLYDNAGLSVTYDAAQLAQIFNVSSFNLVNNGTVAAYPPVLGKGVLSSTTISLSSPFPQLRAAVQVSDTPTGVTQALLFLTPPGATYRQAELATIPLPVKSGAVPMYDDFNSFSPTGNWTISEYSVCDFAGNCTSSTDPATIISLFGTNTITVTN